MANNCYFEMKIAGKEENVQELVEMLQHKGRFKEAGLGRVFSFDTDDIERNTSGSEIVSIKGYGDCAWSLSSALQKDRDRYPSLESETERLGLVIEAYSSEPGCCFQEHILINQGDVVCEDCVDYEEHWVESMSEEEITDLCNEKNITKEDLMDAVNDNGDYCVGGFGDDFANFKNLFTYFEPELRKGTPTQTLDDKISEASEKSTKTSHSKTLPTQER